MLKTLAKKYFNLFSKKSIGRIAEMLSENVVLNDWETTCSGKEEVLNATQSIFDNVESIDIKLVNIYCEGNSVIAELNIVINNSIMESVLDIITFDNNKKIININAYKQ
jgi:hypothetical protein